MNTLITDLCRTIYNNSRNLQTAWSSVCDGREIVEGEKDWFKLWKMVEDVSIEFSSDGLIDKAISVANGYTIPQELISMNTSQLNALNGDFVSLCKQLTLVKDSDKVSPISLNKWCFNRELYTSDLQFKRDYDLLVEIVEQGCYIDTPSDFTYVTEPPPPRKKQVLLQSVYEKHFEKLFLQGKGILLPMDCLKEWKIPVHFSSPHWTEDKNKPLGRLLIDCAELNEVSESSAVDERYGTVTLPTLQDILTMFTSEANKAGGFENILFYKEDISAAFNHFRINPNHVHLFGVAIRPDLVWFYLYGMFGWTGCPAVWAVFTRVLLSILRTILVGSILAYVDDFIGVARKDQAAKDQDEVQSTIRGLLGFDAINSDKIVPPTDEGEVLGWHVNLVTQLVRPNDRSIRKLLYLFVRVIPWDHKVAVDRNLWEKVAGVTNRYATCLTGMRPFVSPFFGMLNRRAGKHTNLSPSNDAWICICVWRVVIIWLTLRPDTLSVPFTHVLRDKLIAEAYIRCDAGPEGIGVGVWRDYEETELLGYMQYVFPFDAIESKHQNCREFLGVALSLILCAKLKLCGKYVLPKQDNVSSIAWVKNDTTKSSKAFIPFLLVTWLKLLFRITVVRVEHYKGNLMGNIDALSRGQPHSFPTDKEWVLNPITREIIDDLFRICNPEEFVRKDLTFEEISDYLNLVCTTVTKLGFK